MTRRRHFMPDHHVLSYKVDRQDRDSAVLSMAGGHRRLPVHA
jgi:hypothetical protein